MSLIYEAAHISKQAHYKYMKRLEREEEFVEIVVDSVLKVRCMHPVMGIKKIYLLLSPDWISRDRFIRIAMQNGLGIKQFKNFARTTFSSKTKWFINLTVNLAITGINQVWVSDITYFRIGDTFYYLTFVVDVYSRRILGYTASKTLHAEANCIALEMAIRSRKGMKLNGLIHHSDRGSQYVSKQYLKLLTSNEIAASMCDSVYENTHIERINGIIKNEYLNTEPIKSYKELKVKLKKAVKIYNDYRIHWNLKAMTPSAYEENLKMVTFEERDILTLYSEPNQKVELQLFYD